MQPLIAPSNPAFSTQAAFVHLVGATKIISDYVDSLRGLGDWLGGAEHES
jgi:hypothetical protein